MVHQTAKPCGRKPFVGNWIAPGSWLVTSSVCIAKMLYGHSKVYSLQLGQSCVLYIAIIHTWGDQGMSDHKKELSIQNGAQMAHQMNLGEGLSYSKTWESRSTSNYSCPYSRTWESRSTPITPQFFLKGNATPLKIKDGTCLLEVPCTHSYLISSVLVFSLLLLIQSWIASIHWDKIWIASLRWPGVEIFNWI